MKIAVFGLGYVGTVTAGCLAREGHSVIGVDIVEEKVDRINRGESPVVEESISEIINAKIADGSLEAVNDHRKGLQDAEMAIICVGTPSDYEGRPDLRSLRKVTEQIGDSLSEISDEFTFVLRSTVPPGTTESVVLPELNSDGQSEDVPVVVHPEFLREGSSVRDFYNPPKLVAGATSDSAAERVFSLYPESDAPRVKTTFRVAESIKLIDNSFHALKVTFANEVGRFCERHDIDSREVMELVKMDDKLNISTAYLTPGMPFGGSCLPKDLQAMVSRAQQDNLRLPLLESILQSNQKQEEKIINRIARHRRRKVGVVGLSFKPGTDDLRESPLLRVVEALVGKGFDVSVYDEEVREAHLMGSNKRYVERHVPHLSEFLEEELADFHDRDLIVIGHPIGADQVHEWLEEGKQIIDLVGIEGTGDHSGYEGLYW